MARLAAYQNGNLTGATTWKSIDTTSFLMSIAGNTATTTSFVGSANFAPGAITVEGIGLFLLGRAASPSGTFEVQLWNSTTSTQVALVTVNVADLPAPATGTTIVNHCFFEFSAPVLLVAGNNYQVRVRSSVAGQVTVYRDGTAGNWSRWLRTNSIVSAAATDDFWIVGSLTGAGTNTPITVTMDNNNTNQYGYCVVGQHGTLDWVTASNTELRLGGDALGGTNGNSLYITGGTVNVGTSAARIASGVTSTLRFNSTGNTTTTMNGIQIWTNGIFRAYGQRRTNNWVLLTADAAAGATSLTVASGHGFVTGDVIGIAPTNRTTTQFEARTLTGTTATTLSFTGGLASSKSGTAPTQAEIINVTRNLVIRGNSATQTTFVIANTGCIIDLDSAQFLFAGGGRTAIVTAAGVQGLSIGSCTIQHCAFSDTGAAGTYISTATANPKDTNITNNVFYNHLTNGIAFTATAPTAGSNCSVSDNVLIGGSNTGITITNPDVTCSGNRVSGCITFGILHGSVIVSNINSAVVSNNVCHTNQLAMQLSLCNTNDTGNHAVGNVGWRNSVRGFYFYSCNNSQINDLVAFGNATSNILLTAGNQNPVSDLYVNNATLNSEASFVTTYGVEINASNLTSATAYAHAHFDNCTFGGTTAHTIADVITNSIAGVTVNCNILMNDCTLNATTPILNNTQLGSNDFISVQRLNGSATDHRKFLRNGILRSDSTIVRSSPLSARITPSSTTLKQEAARKIIAVASSTTATVGVYVRCSVVGDGTAYNGARPRLILVKNPSLGIDTDQVLATATVAANGAWELISGTTPTFTANGAIEVYVDVDGNAGWVNIDDFSVS